MIASFVMLTGRSACGKTSDDEKQATDTVVDAELEWQWNGGHVLSEVLADALNV